MYALEFEDAEKDKDKETQTALGKGALGGAWMQMDGFASVRPAPTNPGNGKACSPSNRKQVPKSRPQLATSAFRANDVAVGASALLQEGNRKVERITSPYVNK